MISLKVKHSHKGALTDRAHHPTTFHLQGDAASLAASGMNGSTMQIMIGVAESDSEDGGNETSGPRSSKKKKKKEKKSNKKVSSVSCNFVVCFQFLPSFICCPNLSRQYLPSSPKKKIKESKKNATKRGEGRKTRRRNAAGPRVYHRHRRRRQTPLLNLARAQLKRRRN
jgi:hypothetical protein